MLTQKDYKIITNSFGRKLTEDEVLDMLKNNVVGMIAGVEPLTKRVLESVKSLRVISRCGIGLDSVDTDVAQKLNIKVFNTPSAPVAAVAELTIALILDVLRKVSQTDRTIRQGYWKQFMGSLLASKTVGVIGCGRIGSKVSKLLKAFNAQVLVTDQRHVLVAPDIINCQLDELLNRSDIITLHIPYGPSTHHFIQHERIMKMKAGSILINASRGGLIDEQALFNALQSGHLAGAGLDTFEEEPYNGPLITLPQVVLTAHMGSYAKETRTQMEREAAENLLEGLTAAGLFDKM